MIKAVNDSKFNMWRACIAAIWIDGKVSDEELSWINDKLALLPFADEQRKILKADLELRPNFEEIVSKISDRKDRAFLAHQIRVISHLDNDYSESEMTLFENWNNIVLNGLDTELLSDSLDSSSLVDRKSVLDYLSEKMQK